MKISLPPPRLRTVLTAAALAASVMSCNRDQVVPDAPAAITQANQELAAVAKALAHTLGEDAATRQLLKTEALKQFDGDYDVLYRAFAAQQPAFGQAMDKLADMAGTLAQVPNLNISVPVNIDKWQAATYAPLVLFIPADFDEKTYTKPLQAYDKDGRVHLLDAKKAPDYPVVVIGPSERVKGTALTSENFGPGKGAAGGAKGGGSTTNRVPADDPNYPGDPYYPYPPTPPSTPPQYYATCRTDKHIEYLKGMWMEDVSEYESWFLGAPEIRLQILAPIGATGNNGGTIYDALFSMSRGAIEDFWYCDTSLYYWDKALTSDAVKYVWLEQDGGTIATEEITIEYTVPNGGPKVTSKTTFQIGNEDDKIGSPFTMNFEFCPNEKYYQVGGGTYAFRWLLENR